jgi:urea transport system permease protein
MKKITSPCTENLSVGVLLIFSCIFPFVNSAYNTFQLTGFFITCLVSFSLTLIWGYTGIFSFGQAAFYGIGAYTYSIISLSSQANLTWIAMLAGVGIATGAALLLGYFIFYGGVNEIFTGIITLCVSTVLETLVVQSSSTKILGVTLGGFNGITNIPQLHIGTFTFYETSLYFLVIAIVFGVYFLMRVLTTSNTGYALFGIRESRIRSELFGYTTAKIQMLTFGASGAIAGLGGTLFAAWSGYVVPSTLSVASSTVAVVMVALAGRKNVTGALIMTLVYSAFTQELAGSGNSYSNIILGILLVVIVTCVPGGVLEGFFNFVDNKVPLFHNQSAQT